MREVIARLIGPAVRGRRRSSKVNAAPSGKDVTARGDSGALGSGPHPAARRIALEIDSALGRGQWLRAERLTQSGARIMHTSARLTECIARLRLAQGRAETALAIIDAATMQSTSLKMLRMACLLELGRAGEAHLALREWSRKSTAPMEARRLLALLEFSASEMGAGTGDRDAGLDALLHNLRQIEDPRTLALLILDAVAQGRREQAEHWAQRLALAARWTEEVGALATSPAALMETLGLDSAAIDRATPAASTAQIETLAMELVATPGVEQALAVLVRVQEESHDLRTVQLLYESTKLALDSLAQPAAGCDALARLALMLGRRDEAIEWARRGAMLNPMSASLARLVHEVDAAAEVEEAEERTISDPPAKRRAA